MRLFVTLFLSTTALIGIQSAKAQWSSDTTKNTPVAIAQYSQEYPSVVSDNNNGVFVVWADYRSGGWDVYAQHLDANGKRLWGDAGVPVCDTPGSAQRYPKVAADNIGGCWVVWEDERNSTRMKDIYGQRIKSDGTRAWKKQGLAVSDSMRDQYNATIVADGTGNAFVAWEDDRNPKTSYNPDINLNKLSVDTVLWGRYGKITFNQNGGQKNPRMVADGQGGVVLVYENGNTVPQSVYGARIASDGTVTWGFNKFGYKVYGGQSSANLSYNPSITRDGNEFLVVWEVAGVSSTNGRDLYANRLRMDTTKYYDPAAEVTGSWPGDQVNASIFPDDSTGALIVFEDNSGGDLPPTFLQQDIAMIRLLPNGVETRPPLGNAPFYIARQSYGQVKPKAVKSDDGVIVVWNDARNATGDSSVYAQKADRRLKRYFPTFGTNSSWGQPIASSPTSKAKQSRIAERTNGAIAVWVDDRNGNNDIYAQLIFRDGSLPVELASFSLAPAGSGRVQLRWQTASEKDNAGFEIERRTLGSLDNNFRTVASFRYDAALRGTPQSNTLRDYRFIDTRLDNSIYEYRLVDYALDGTRTEHEAKTINLSVTDGAGEWSIEQNTPNPFSDRSRVSFTLARAARVEMTLTDVTGRAINVPSGSGYWSAGMHSAQIETNALGLANGAYLLRVQAYDQETGEPVWSNNKGMMLQVIR